MAQVKQEVNKQKDEKGRPVEKGEGIEYKPGHTTIGQLMAREEDAKLIGEEFVVCGHVRSAQSTFVHLYDGTTHKTLQLVFEKKQMQRLLAQVGGGPLSPSTTLTARVKIQKSLGGKQKLDAVVLQDTAQVLGPVIDKSTFLPAIKNVSIETWRQHCDVRVHNPIQAAIFRIRSRLSSATHAFMESKGVFHLDPNTITSADCEGAGEMFIVTTLGESGIESIPALHKSQSGSHVVFESKDSFSFKEDDAAAVKKSTPIDWRQDFFRNDIPCRLTVSSQLQLEALAYGMTNVYTSNPSYRAEQSQTSRHLASFTHIEAELSYLEFVDLQNFIEEYVVYCIKTLLKKGLTDLQLLETSGYAPGVIAKLEQLVSKPFGRISYSQAIDVLTANEKDVKQKFPEVKEIPKWGEDLGSHCERYLSEIMQGHPMFVKDMPEKLKSVYMRRNTYGKTVQGCDLLMPGMGELVGGSMRESDYCKLARALVERDMYDPKQSTQLAKDKIISILDAALDAKATPEVKKDAWDLIPTIDFKAMSWYVALRRNAATPTGGFGLGFERLVAVCTSGRCIDAISKKTVWQSVNIRECVPFPVAFKECHF
jgi:asparaginyl-tRNA synthetase